MAQTEFNAVGFSVRQVLSGLEGASGLGFSIGTNLTLDVQTTIGTAVLRNTPYAITYTDPVDGAKVKSILHDPSIPYQDKLPEGVILTLTVPASTQYLAFSATFTIQPNTQPVWRIRLAFTQAFVKTTKKTYF